MLNKLKTFFANLLQADFTLKEYWETEKYGTVPEFPAIEYDKSIKADFRFFIKADHYYCDESIGLKPDDNEIIIDCRGRAFGLIYNSEHQFCVPKLITDQFPTEELKTILRNYWNINDIDQYLSIDNVGDIIKKMAENKSNFGYKQDKSTTA